MLASKIVGLVLRKKVIARILGECDHFPTTSQFSDLVFWFTIVIFRNYQNNVRSRINGEQGLVVVPSLLLNSVVLAKAGYLHIIFYDIAVSHKRMIFTCEIISCVCSKLSGSVRPVFSILLLQKKGTYNCFHQPISCFYFAETRDA